MKKTKQQSSFMNMGTSLLLVIFLVLTLVTFAVLSLSSAKSDYNLSAKLAKHKTEYYDVSAKAEAVLSEIDERLETLAQESHNDTTSYYAAAGEQFDQVSLQDTLLALRAIITSVQSWRNIKQNTTMPLPKQKRFSLKLMKDWKHLHRNLITTPHPIM